MKKDFFVPLAAAFVCTHKKSFDSIDYVENEKPEIITNILKRKRDKSVQQKTFRGGKKSRI